MVGPRHLASLLSPIGPRTDRISGFHNLLGAESPPLAGIYNIGGGPRGTLVGAAERRRLTKVSCTLFSAVEVRFGLGQNGLGERRTALSPFRLLGWKR
ncbi:hypothetical protein E143388_06084 [Rhodococcus opacus]|nr:hypothetical protein E143388_06084 [Rhodococcus opacus]